MKENKKKRWTRKFCDLLIGKFQEEKIRTTPSGSGSNSPFAGKKTKGILLCNIIHSNREIN